MCPAPKTARNKKTSLDLRMSETALSTFRSSTLNTNLDIPDTGRSGITGIQVDNERYTDNTSHFDDQMKTNGSPCKPPQTKGLNHVFIGANGIYNDKNVMERLIASNGMEDQAKSLEDTKNKTLLSKNSMQHGIVLMKVVLFISVLAIAALCF